LLPIIFINFNHVYFIATFILAGGLKTTSPHLFYAYMFSA